MNQVTVFGIPLLTLIAAGLIIALALLVRRIFSVQLINRVSRLTRKTRSDLDDQLLDLLNAPVGWLIVLGGVWVAYLLLHESISPALTGTIDRFFGLALVLIVAVIFFRTAGLTATAFTRLTRLTDTELDDLVAPYIPIFIRTIAVILVVMKLGEVLLGLSAAAFIGLLGGAGITIGLVFRDVLSDWFSTILIYTDNLYREGDLIELPNREWAFVDKIGLRSTTLRLHADGIVTKIPNSRMVRAGVANRSRSDHWGVRFELKLDGVSNVQIEEVAKRIRNLLQTDPDIVPDQQRAFLRRLEGNSRVIGVRLWTARTNYYAVVERVNLGILAVLDEAGIDPLAVSYTVFSPAPEGFLAGAPAAQEKRQ